MLNTFDRDPVLTQYANGAATTGYVLQLGNPGGRRFALDATWVF